MLNTTLEFYLRTRELYPDLARRADVEYVKYWGEAPTGEESSYSWFESVANALNNDMCQGLFLQETAAFFDDVTSILLQCSDEVSNCIDVSFVENLFWRVPAKKSISYWKVLLPPLNSYIWGFTGSHLRLKFMHFLRALST